MDALAEKVLKIYEDNAKNNAKLRSERKKDSSELDWVKGKLSRLKTTQKAIQPLLSELTDLHPKTTWYQRLLAPSKVQKALNAGKALDKEISTTKSKQNDLDRLDQQANR